MFFRDKSIAVFYMQVTDKIDTNIFNYVLSLVSGKKRKKVQSFFGDIDRKMSLYADVIVRLMLCRKYNLRNEDIVFEEGEFGKPFLKNLNDFHFNISHTRNGIAVAFADSPIGIDIEKIKQDDRLIAERFFVSDEFKYIYSSEQEQGKRFFEVWTKKEAYIKCLGKGLSMELNSFNVFDECNRLKYNEIYVDDYIISVFRDNVIEKTDFYKLNEEDFYRMTFGLKNVE